MNFKAYEVIYECESLLLLATDEDQFGQLLSDLFTLQIHALALGNMMETEGWINLNQKAN